MYDIVIIGAGVIGCSIARELSKYKLKIGVIEKELDVCEGSSMANSAIVHSGYDPKPGSMKSRMNAKGNSMFDTLSKELDFEFERIGSLTVAKTQENIDAFPQIVANAKLNGVDVKILSPEELFKLEPYVTKEALGAIWAPTAGIVNPFEYTIALMENAMDNGVELNLDTQVLSIDKKEKSYVIHTNKKDFETKIVVNAAGLFSGKIAEMVGNNSITITPRKGEYFVLDHFKEPFVTHTIFPMPTKKGKGILVTPTTHWNYLLGPTSEFVDDPSDVSTDTPTLANVRANVVELVPNIPFFQVIRSFAGLRAVSNSDDFILEEDKNNSGFFNCAGIQSPGLASSPAIAEYIVGLISNRITLEKNPLFNPIRRPLYRFNSKTMEEKDELIRKDPTFGHIVCRCERISEGEVLDAIHRNCGAKTIRGVKKRVRPGFGKCQGGFCEPIVLKMLAKELKVDPVDIRYGNKDSFILNKPTKDGGVK